MTSLTRRSVLWGGAVPFSIPERASKADPGADELWQSFRQKFITAEGRVIDTANGNISHSEGQGWGLLFAAWFDDRKTFDSLYRWTTATLRRPHDRLHAWRFDPAAVPPVADLNNATDGDIFIAASLARAAARWGNDTYAQASRAISRDILARLVRRVGTRLVLLPAHAGFERQDGTVINLSYYAFPFLSELARIMPAPQWELLMNDGLSLINTARFGKWMLPPDWLLLAHTGELRPAAGWPPRFSYDAIRIPLWLVWSRRMPGAVNASYLAFWDTPNPPAWADLATNETSSYPASPGIQAVIRLTEAAAAHTAPDLPAIGTNATYYDGSLILLSWLAFRAAQAR